jgi:hypothetical protein
MLEKITLDKDILEKNYSKKLQPLFELESDSLTRNNFNYDEFRFTQDDIDELIGLATDSSYKLINYQEHEELVERFFYGTIHAVNILGKIKAVESIEFILKKMEEESEGNEYFLEAFVSYVTNMGINGLDFFEKYIFEKPEEYNLISIFDGIDYMLEEEPSSVSRVEEIMIMYLKNEKTHPAPLSFAISTLINIGEDKHIDLIRETFKTKDVDTLLRGDLEDIEIELGLREKRVTNNSVERTFEELMNRNINSKSKVLEPKVGRNNPCPCGSGKKHKKCCLNK